VPATLESMLGSVNCPGWSRELSIAFLFVLAGCSSSDSDSEDVPAKCNEVGQSLCESNANCAVETRTIAQSDRITYLANCVSGFKQALDCSRVTKITGHPDTCESEVAATPCAQFDPTNGLPLPASCRSIFQ
jgi:hypothetical protein